jgi:hypothetical protein
MKSTLREALNRILSIFRREPLDRDLDGELASHLDFAVDDNIKLGMSPAEARRQALIRFGGVQQAKERQRDARGLPWFEILRQDLRYTFRTLKRDRGFTIIAILILGLGIGANVVVFSVVNTLLLRPLPFRDPHQLARILTKDPKGGESSMTYSADATEEFQQRTRFFQRSPATSPSPRLTTSSS